MYTDVYICMYYMYILYVYVIFPFLAHLSFQKFFFSFWFVFSQNLGLTLGGGGERGVQAPG